MKVLFLDVDGVLNHNKTRERCLNYLGVDKALAKRLTDWLEGKDVKIVLSSTWRRFPEMHEHLKENGICWIGVTPFFPNRERGDEIMAWLDENETTAFAVLDDCSDMSAVINCFVLTNPDTGLTDENLKQVEKILGL
jgi:hypothetical protein